MRKNIAGMVTLAILSLFIGFSSFAVAETNTSAASDNDQMAVTLPEIVCTAGKTPTEQTMSYREYLNEAMESIRNEAMESIRDSLGRIQLKNIMEEVKSLIHQNL